MNVIIATLRRKRARGAKGREGNEKGTEIGTASARRETKVSASSARNCSRQVHRWHSTTMNPVDTQSISTSTLRWNIIGIDYRIVSDGIDKSFYNRKFIRLIDKIIVGRCSITHFFVIEDNSIYLARDLRTRAIPKILYVNRFLAS